MKSDGLSKVKYFQLIINYVVIKIEFIFKVGGIIKVLVLY